MVVVQMKGKEAIKDAGIARSRLDENGNWNEDENEDEDESRNEGPLEDSGKAHAGSTNAAREETQRGLARLGNKLSEGAPSKGNAQRQRVCCCCVAARAETCVSKSVGLNFCLSVSLPLY